MTLPPVADRWTLDAANAERLAAIAAFGFTERQAKFLLHVLLHAGVFVERQYCAFAGIVHGQKSTNFIRALVDRRLATPITIGKLHRGRMVHVHYKPLWAAIGEPDNRFRKPAAPGRMIERVMLLDAVLDDHETVWLGPATDKRRYFMRELAVRVELREFPQVRFGTGPEISIRYFPDKLPIGVHADTGNHVFAYLVTKPSPMDFRLFPVAPCRAAPGTAALDDPAAGATAAVEGDARVPPRRPGAPRDAGALVCRGDDGVVVRRAETTRGSRGGTPASRVR